MALDEKGSWLRTCNVPAQYHDEQLKKTAQALERKAQAPQLVRARLTVEQEVQAPQLMRARLIEIRRISK